MRYYITYSCGCGDNAEVIEAETLREAEDYACERAIEEYQSYEGLHGIRDWDEIRDECDSDDEADDIYHGEVESSIDYGAEPYDETNEDHVDAYNG